MAKKMPIGQFVAQLEAALNRKDGYIMGAKGQNPKKLSSWYFQQYKNRENYTEKQEKKALYWRENAEHVWDCNGLAEGIYQEWSGVNIDTRARYNYSGWCGTKGKGRIPAKHRVPGAAVFIYSSSSGYITHVGYLYKPVVEGNPSGDWWVIEARSVLYGVVKTKLNSRGWNRWGIMTKYFDYTNDTYKPAEMTLGDRNLKNGCEGDDVKQLQTNLIRLGYNCGKWGADGEFGDATELAIEAFQRKYGLEVDGVYGQKSHAAMEKAMAAFDAPSEQANTVKIIGGDCWVRSEPNTSGAKLGVAHEGDTFIYNDQTSEEEWHAIEYKGSGGWVSGKYGKLN